MKNYRIYGWDNTNLTLTEKAHEVYSNSDPIEIKEFDDGYYSISGIIDRDGMTADEVNELLEELAD